ncbi:MAG: hypothetical protein S0880_29950 [Actinomycetota bacterium]|nr:hypothetical protein [Actinomycetota bacterium]
MLQRIQTFALARAFRADAGSTWLWVGAGAWALRFMTRRRPEVLYRAEIRPGRNLVVRHLTTRRRDI